MKKTGGPLLAVCLVLAMASLAQAETLLSLTVPELNLTLGKKPVYIEPAEGTPTIQSSERMPFGLTTPFEIEKYDFSDPSDKAQVDQFMQEIDDIGVNVISHHFGRVYDSEGQPDFALHEKEIKLYIRDHNKYFWGASRPRSTKCFLGDIDGNTHQVITTQQDLDNAINSGHKCIPYSTQGLAEYENWLNQALDIFNNYPGSINKFAYFQIGNEPDKWFKKKDNPDPTNPNDWYHDAYAQIVERAYPIIKNRAPNTKVVIGTPGADSVAIEGFYQPILQNLYNNGNRKCGGAGCFNLFDYHLYGKHMAYNERPVIKQVTITKSYEYFRELLDSNGFPDKGLVIQQGGTYTGQDIWWAEIFQNETKEAIFLVKRMAYKIAKGMEQNQIISLIELFCFGDTIHSPFTIMGLEYNGSPIPGGTSSCLDISHIPAQYDCGDQQPCPDPGFGVKKLSYWTYKFLIEKLRGSDWGNAQTIYEEDNVYVYKFNKQGQPMYVAWWDWWNETGETKEVTLTLADMTGSQAKITEAIPDAQMGKDLNPNDYPNFFNSYIVDLTLPDYIAIIREKISGKQGLFIYGVPLGLDSQTEPPVATDRHFGNSNWGNNIIAMTCIDTDGDRFDEIAVIRQIPRGRQRLEIYNPPESEGGDTGNPIASDLTFGHLYSDKNNIAMAGVDIDGDGTDEIAVIREKQTGKQRLFIFNAPQGIGGQTEPAIATDMTFGFRDTGRNIIAMTGLDTNGDGTDEIAVIMERASGRQRLEIYDAPQDVGGETGPPIASDLTFGDSTTRKNTILITNVDVNGDNIDEIAVVRQRTDGWQRLEIYNPPETPNGETGPPIASDLTFGGTGIGRNTMAISGMKF